MGFKENGHKPIIKSTARQLHEAVVKLGEYERDITIAKKHIQELSWALARRQTAINALGTHFNLEPEAMKEIIEAFMLKEEEKMKAQVEGAKEKFKENIAKGIMPEGFKIVANPEKDNVTPFPAPLDQPPPADSPV